MALYRCTTASCVLDKNLILAKAGNLHEDLVSGAPGDYTWDSDTEPFHVLRELLG